MIRQVIITISLAFIFNLLNTSCVRPETETVSEEEASEAIQEAVSADTYGMGAQLVHGTIVLFTHLNHCGQTGDSTVVRARTTGPVTYNYEYSWDWSLSCTQNNLPSTFEFNYSTDGQYETPRMLSDDNSTGGFTLSGIEPSSPTWVYNGSYIRNGTQTSKVGNQSTFTSQIEIHTNNLTVAKNGGGILSGDADVSITGTHFNGNPFSFTGSIDFLGNGNANLTINGTVYPISL